MISPHEFTAGALGDAIPLSLILPRTKNESTILIGQIENRPTAIFLSGQRPFYSFECTGNRAWKGLIIPNVDVEVDETSLFDPDREEFLGAIIRTDTRLITLGKNEYSFGSIEVTLHADLTPTNDARVAFSKWQIVLGEGQAKRILTRVDVNRVAVS